MNVLSLLVLKAVDPSALARFYAKLGLTFVQEQHGSGPIHLSCHVGESVFEIYPRSASEMPTSGTRIGFRVPSVADAISACDAPILMAARPSQWGIRAVIEDPEGHKVELSQSFCV
ncbi:VOC family protein [Xanthomonas axonopodis]|uniref:VOC family protein n=1 Tax=Xanthomonas axonopodis TaxID=53413 RepID=UPI003555F66A